MIAIMCPVQPAWQAVSRKEVAVSIRHLATMLLALTLAGPARAQDHQQHPPASAHAQQTSYAGLERRAIKALSDQQIEDLRAGHGMGLALAAELNGYPGPLHTLELADQLGLSSEQWTRTAAAVNTMKRETIAIGQELIAAEAELDRLFAGRTVTPESLNATVLRTATMQGRLRAAHLRYHLDMVAILTPEQAAAYARLRGYAPGPVR